MSASRRKRKHAALCVIGIGVSPLLQSRTMAQTVAGQGPASRTEDITVIGISPLPGSGIDRDKIPEQTTVIESAELARDGTPDVLHALDNGTAGLSLDSAAGNPFQPTSFYNGFESSPLQGTSQGIAVYLNGIRFNQPFGDTVNWDLIPDIAIRRVTIEGSNPVFGLNALGGAVNIQLRDGFSNQGGEADVSGGSFGQVKGEFQYNVRHGNVAVYLAASEEHQDG